MVRLLDKELEDIISYIKNSDSYKKCIEIQEKMESNVEIKNLVANVKSLQKQYVKSDFQNEKIKKENPLNYKDVIEKGYIEIGTKFQKRYFALMRSKNQCLIYRSRCVF